MSIHALPVEILARIFVQGVQTGPPSPFLLRPHHKQPLSPQTPTLDFQILVSHVCQRWRTIALETSSLWTTLVFLEFRDIERGRALLARAFPKGSLVDPTTIAASQNQNVPEHKNQDSNVHGYGARPVPASKLITIVISTVAQADHVEGVTIAKSDLHRIFWMLRYYLPAWRALHLIVRDNLCKAVAREHLGGCGPALSLETLQLYHFEDFREAQDLYLATYRPPVVVFANTLPRLRNVSLIGVNLPWEKSPYLYDGRLRCLELALHADKVRPPYELWERMLRGCGAKLVDVTNGTNGQQTTVENKPEEGISSLEELYLHYSGPKAGEGEGRYAWTSIDDGQTYSESKQWKRRIWMPRMEKMSLTDLDPDYLCKVMETMVLPAIRNLELELPEQDYTQFVEMLGAKKGEEVILPPPLANREDPDSSPASPDSGTFPSPQRTDDTLPTNGISELTLTAPGLDLNDNLYKSVLKRVDAESRTFPALWRVEQLSIAALMCSGDSWRGFLRALTGLRILEIDFGRTGEEFWRVFMEREDPTALDKNKQPTLLPSLQTVKLSGLEGSQIVETIHWRSVPPVSHGMNGKGVARWFVKWSERQKGKDTALDDLVYNGVWVKVEGEMVHKRVQCWEEDDLYEDEDEDEEEEEEEEEALGEEEDADGDDDNEEDEEEDEEEEY